MQLEQLFFVAPPSRGGWEWQQANHDLANTRDASSSTILSENVSELGVGWTYGIEGASAFGSLATSPLVVNGTVYLQDLKSNVYAIDFRSGKLEWQKRYNADNVGPNGAGFDDGVCSSRTGCRRSWPSMRRAARRYGPSGSSGRHPGDHATAHGPRRHPLREHHPRKQRQSLLRRRGDGIIHALDERTGNELCRSTPSRTDSCGGTRR